MIRDINKRLTEIQDKFLADKAENSRLINIGKKLYNKEFERIRLWKKFGHYGPYTFKELLKDHYEDAIKRILCSSYENPFLNLVAKITPFEGARLMLPGSKDLE